MRGEDPDDPLLLGANKLRGCHFPRRRITFRDIVGKLTVLRLTRDKCGRSGQYCVDRLILRYGIDAKLFDWSDDYHGRLPAEAFRQPLQPVWRTVPGPVQGGLTPRDARWYFGITRIGHHGDGRRGGPDGRVL